MKNEKGMAFENMLEVDLTFSQVLNLDSVLPKSFIWWQDQLVKCGC